MLSRRSMFGASAAAIIASVPAVTVASPSADAALLDLGLRYEKAFADYQQAVSTSKATWAAFKARRPEPSPAMMVSQIDAIDFGIFKNAGQPLSIYSYRALERWLSRPDLRNTRASDQMEPRARALMQAYDEHEAAEERMVVATGHKAASEAEDALYEKACELERAIIATPCSTLAGLRVKAMVAHNNREPADHEPDFPTTAAFSVIDALLNGGLN